MAKKIHNFNYCLITSTNTHRLVDKIVSDEVIRKLYESDKIMREKKKLAYHMNTFYHNPRHVQAQRQDANAKWSLSEDFQVVYSDAAGEVVVGGVFLRLFIANPAWVLRRPKEFLTELLEQWTKAAGSSNPNVSSSWDNLLFLSSFFFFCIYYRPIYLSGCKLTL